MNKATAFEALFKNSNTAVIILETDTFNAVYCNPEADKLIAKCSNVYLKINQNLKISSLKEIFEIDSFKINKNIQTDILVETANLKESMPYKATVRSISWEKNTLLIIELFENKTFVIRHLPDSTAEKLLHQVLDLVPEPIFLKDNQRKFILVNKSFLEYHRATNDQILGKTDEEVKDNQSECSKFIEDDIEVIETGKAKYIDQETYTSPDGKRITLQTTKLPFVLKQNEKPGILGIAIDITDKLAFRTKLVSNRRMQRQIVDLVPHMIYLKDFEGKFVFVNKEFLRRTGKKESEILGKTAFEIYPEEQAQRYVNEDREVMHSLKELVIEKEFGPMYEGSMTVYNTIKKPYYEYDNNKVGVLAICTDLTEKLRSKELLDQQKVMLNEIINLLPQEIYLKDDEGKMLMVNKACADDLQVTQEYLIGKTDFDVYTKESADCFYKLEQEILKDGRKRYLEEEISIDKNNVKRIKSVMKMPFYLSDKRKNGILGMNIDITETKNAEKQIKDSELRYKTLMEQASDGIYLSDDDGNIIAANQKAAEIFGYTLEEFKIQNIKKIVAPDFEQHQTVRMPFNDDKQSLILERKFQKKDGNTFTAELSVKLLEDGKHQAILRDVTERKKMEKILVDNERKFRLLIENSSDLIIILSKNFIIKFMSPSVSRLLGFEESNLIGSSILELLAEESIEDTSRLFSHVLSNEEHLTIQELKLKNKKEEFLLFETVAVNMLEDENINGIIINCHDVTKRKNTENELINTNFELDSFVYKASHDLKAPLRSVMGLIKLARLESTDTNLEIYFDMMSKSVTSLDSFIRDLTQFSRNSRMEMESSEIQFEEIIKETLDNLKFVERADQIKVNIKLELSSKFYSDRTRIATIINNLLSNAFKYHRFDNNNPYLNVSISADDEKSIIVVEDNGIGIEKVHLNYIFDMFYRASETSYGSGLGLYILKTAITKIKGKVEVQSELGQGTTFSITIPNFLNKSESIKI